MRLAERLGPKSSEDCSHGVGNDGTHILGADIPVVDDLRKRVGERGGGIRGTEMALRRGKTRSRVRLGFIAWRKLFPSRPKELRMQVGPADGTYKKRGSGKLFENAVERVSDRPVKTTRHPLSCSREGWHG